MERFAILLSGPVRPGPALAQALAARRVIAADGGIAHAPALGLVPELWVGDFDSVPGDLPDAFAGVERQAVAREKDETDGELAFRAALARGAGDILVVGALRGPRSDHAFANLVLALRTAALGHRVELFDGRERAIPLTTAAPTLVDCRPGQIFSILRFSAVRGLTLRGARWPLRAVDLPFHSILTQSNEALGPVEIALAEGEAMLVLQEADDEAPDGA